MLNGNSEQMLDKVTVRLSQTDKDTVNAAVWYVRDPGFRQESSKYVVLCSFSNKGGIVFPIL